ncbi:MAG: hypothetical protein COA54_02335 [Thiotrichaceae bacterium]|nr:MAG: hypothetical protein COA54_02335 [Thiotrichaceae bacterium]
MFNTDDLLTALQDHIGKEKGICGIKLAQKLSGRLLHNEPFKRHIRKLVQDLRQQGHHICATPQDGYYIAANEAELNETCEFLHERAMSSLKQISAMKKIALPDLRGQLRLNT